MPSRPLPADTAPAVGFRLRESVCALAQLAAAGHGYRFLARQLRFPPETVYAMAQAGARLLLREGTAPDFLRDALADLPPLEPPRRRPALDAPPPDQGATEVASSMTNDDHFRPGGFRGDTHHRRSGPVGPYTPRATPSGRPRTPPEAP